MTSLSCCTNLMHVQIMIQCYNIIQSDEKESKKRTCNFNTQNYIYIYILRLDINIVNIDIAYPKIYLLKMSSKTKP